MSRSEANKSSKENLQRKKAELELALKKKSANVMRLQLQIRKKREEELSQTEEAVLKANTRKVFLERYLRRQQQTSEQQLAMAKMLKPQIS